ncbi:MAG: helix-turn-helix domain-containing protein [Candidatus Omnitrophica bacterium]|nr:helix-turn-helix domain-containing protein [Candidatus Omnitrophota bacterium]
MPETKQSDSLEDYWDIHQAAEILEVSEEELWDLVHRHKIPTHTVGGFFLRFKKEDIDHLKNKWRIERELFPKRGRYFAHQSAFGGPPPGFSERLKDFWYFNDFYILCAALIIALLYFILFSQ